MKHVLVLALVVSSAPVFAQGLPAKAILQCRPQIQPQGISMSVTVFSGSPKTAVIKTASRTHSQTQTYAIQPDGSGYSALPSDQKFHLEITNGSRGSLNAIYNGSELAWDEMVCVSAHYAHSAISAGN